MASPPAQDGGPPSRRPGTSRQDLAAVGLCASPGSIACSVSIASVSMGVAVYDGFNAVDRSRFMIHVARVYTCTKVEDEIEFNLIDVEAQKLDATVGMLVENGYELLPDHATAEKYIEHIVEV